LGFHLLQALPLVAAGERGEALEGPKRLGSQRLKGDRDFARGKAQLCRM
jgi:hypothetical protein